jgi:hypothetical protein
MCAFGIASDVVCVAKVDSAAGSSKRLESTYLVMILDQTSARCRNDRKTTLTYMFALLEIP